MNRLNKILITFFIVFMFVYTIFQISPWPGALVIRKIFDNSGEKANRALAKDVPPGIITVKNQQYDSKNSSLLFDVYYPKTEKELPIIVWTHGGGFISGNKELIENYAKILASKGYVVFSLDYSIAPENKYPLPLIEVNKALEYISKHHQQYFADKDFIVLAGDSVGSMISAQVANIITNAEYSNIMKIHPGLDRAQLKGVLLYCGFYNLDLIMNKKSPGFFIKTVSWSYFGKKNLAEGESLKTASVTNYLTKKFPPVFISAGNADPLLPQSEFFAKKLKENGIKTNELFFDKNLSPGLNHEYQFTMNDFGKQALEHSLQFLRSLK